MKKLIFIGGGNIAEAIFAKISDTPVVVIEHNQQRLDYIKQKYPQVMTFAELTITTTSEDLVILAIKPQNAKASCLAIKEQISSSPLVSVMAGITTTTLSLWLDNDKISRVMPNTPCLLSLGVSGIFHSSTLNSSIQQYINSIFAKLGIIYLSKTEDDINKITAIASSSPAYVFYFLESLIEVATNTFGFTEEDALAITLQVMKGSIAMLEQNPNLPPRQLRDNITSKNGTTQAALNVLEQRDFKAIIATAQEACYNRAIELGLTQQ